MVQSDFKPKFSQASLGGLSFSPAQRSGLPEGCVRPTTDPGMSKRLENVTEQESRICFLTRRCPLGFRRAPGQPARSHLVVRPGNGKRRDPAGSRSSPSRGDVTILPRLGFPAPAPISVSAGCWPSPAAHPTLRCAP